MNDRSDENRELAILRGAVENTNEAFITIDINHKVVFFNSAAEKIFGYSRDEVVGHDLDVIMSPSCSKNHHHAVERYAKTKMPRLIGHSTEMVAIRKNGETFPADISFSVSEVENKIYFTGIVRDLTATKILQEQMARSERLAALGQVVAEITHEIKNPLMMIGGFARQVIQHTSDEKNLTKLNIITDEVLRLENLLEELREFYLPRISKRNNIHTHTELDRKTPIVKGDRSKLKQVFLNLVKNSIEAIEDGGNITVTSRVKLDLVEITIADDGNGIPEEAREKIFSPFFTTKSHGTGLGLSISKRIIEEHEGSSFALKSEEGKGTVFKVTMPAHGAETEDTEKESL
jgi:two-component system sensor kinase FixL